MKKLSLFFTLAALAFMLPISGFSSIWRINNDNGSPDFTTLQAAVDSEQVVDGDTLYIEGSAIAYEGAEVDKRLVIMGPGYHLEENANTPANSAVPIISTDITLAEGSAGTLITGLTFESSTSNVVVQVSDIIITRNDLRAGRVDVDGTVNNLVITQNLIRTFTLGSIDLSTNMIINNNVFFSGVSVLLYAEIDQFEHNIMLGRNLSVAATFFRNNIIMPEDGDIEIESANITHNISVNPAFDTTGNNVIASAESLFIGPEEGSVDGQYQLAIDSPARGAGVDGTDIGIFGGEHPYVLSGLSNIPVITDFRTPLEADIATGIQVRIQAKSN